MTKLIQFVYTVLLLPLLPTPGFAQSALPPCPADQRAFWNNCVGRHPWGSDEYFGEWQNNRLEGHGALSLASGGWYVGEFSSNRRSGAGIELRNDLTVAREGTWRSDELISSHSVDYAQFRVMPEVRQRLDSVRLAAALKGGPSDHSSWKIRLDSAVQSELRRWLAGDSTGLDEVDTPIFPPGLSLKQEPWETNKEFEDRVATARQERRKMIDRIQLEYQAKVEERNRRVAEFNKARAAREAALPAKRWELIGAGLRALSPAVTLSEVAFDQQTGALTLAAKVDGLNKETFAFTGTAQAFRRAALTEPQSLRAKPEFQVTDAGEIVLQSVALEVGGTVVRGLPSAGVSAPVQLASVNLPQVSAVPLVQQSAVSVDRNQVEQILYRDENEMLRRRLEEQRHQQEQAVSQAEARAAAETARLRAENEALRSQPTQARPPQNLAVINAAHALVIGNSAYSSSNRLVNPVNDARAMAIKLRALGFQVTEIRDASREQMVRGLSEFSRTAARADLTLLFYAGHGVQISGTNYMIPVDLSLNDPVQASLQAVSLNQVVEQYLPGKTKLVFLDACRDNPLMASAARGITKGLAPINVSEGTLISYATKDGQTAEDGTGQTNSPFTTALLEHLGDPDDIAVVLRTVRAKVMQRTSNRQQPWEYGSLTGGALILSAIRR
jgi:hypothetical protein